MFGFVGQGPCNHFHHHPVLVETWLNGVHALLLHVQLFLHVHGSSPRRQLCFHLHQIPLQNAARGQHRFTEPNHATSRHRRQRRIPQRFRFKHDSYVGWNGQTFPTARGARKKNHESVLDMLLKSRWSFTPRQTKPSSNLDKNSNLDKYSNLDKNSKPLHLPGQRQ